MSEEQVIEPEPTPAEPVESAPAAALAAEPSPSAESPNMELLLDVPMSVTVELGRTRMPVRQLLGLSSGSVVGGSITTSTRGCSRWFFFARSRFRISAMTNVGSMMFMIPTHHLCRRHKRLHVHRDPR